MRFCEFFYANFDYRKLLQNTIDFQTMTETILQPKGRHDPAIVHRARVVQDAATALVLCDALSMRFGTDWLK